MDIFVCDATRMTINEHEFSTNIYETFMVIYVTISVPAIHFVVSLSEKRRVAHRETTFLDTIFNAQLFLCATPTPRIEI